jgi:FkbM family methyltransferase
MGLPVRNIREATYRLKNDTRSPSNKTQCTEFPWGNVEYTDFGAIVQQINAIFLEKTYSFNAKKESLEPLCIVDCGSNIGLSAIWFLQTYPGCDLICFEADDRLAAISQRNIRRAGFSADIVHNKAVWIEDGQIGFHASGDDKGTISLNATHLVQCINLSDYITCNVDLLKMDIEGSEYEVLRQVIISGAIKHVKRLSIEFHDVDKNISNFGTLLVALERSGFNIRFRGGNVFALAKGRHWEFDFPSVAPGPLYIELFATRVN